MNQILYFLLGMDLERKEDKAPVRREHGTEDAGGQEEQIPWARG